MTINEFIKQCKKVFGDDIQYKATSKDGQVFKTKGWRDAQMVAYERKPTNAVREVKST